MKEYFCGLAAEMVRFISLDFGHPRVTQVLLILCEVMNIDKLRFWMGFILSSFRFL